DAGLASGYGVSLATLAAPRGPVDAELLAVIGEAQRLNAGTVAALPQHAVRSNGVALDTALLRTQVSDKAERRVDKLTIEIVGLLFERIDQDRLVPAPIKQQLQRLQFPMIRVALTDPELFV